MSDLQAFIDRAWGEHADDAAGVALRLPQALDAVASEDDLLALAHLAHHVYGEHLGAWSDALKYLAALARGPAFQAQGASGKALLQRRASLALAAGESDLRSTLSASDAALVSAQAAALLAHHDTARAGVLLQQAVALAAELPDADPGVRAVAVNANNAARGIAEQPLIESAQREWMMHAAQVARMQWARAGTWLHAERAEYTLAICALAAGDAPAAREHARSCLAIIEQQGEPQPFERFFAHEALALTARSAGDAAAHDAALQAMNDDFARLSEDDRLACRASLDRAA